MNGDKQPTRENKAHADRQTVRPGAQQGPQVLRITVPLNLGLRSGLRGPCSKPNQFTGPCTGLPSTAPHRGRAPWGQGMYPPGVCAHRSLHFSLPRPGTQDPRIISLSGPRLPSGAVWASSLGPPFQGQTTLQWVGLQAWGHAWNWTCGR